MNPSRPRVPDAWVHCLALVGVAWRNLELIAVVWRWFALPDVAWLGIAWRWLALLGVVWWCLALLGTGWKQDKSSRGVQRGNEAKQPEE
eukprot:9493835-Pyramimonas_sp.AAC.1